MRKREGIRKEGGRRKGREKKGKDGIRGTKEKGSYWYFFSPTSSPGL